MKKIRQIEVDGKVLYSFQYTDISDADTWYNEQLSKPNFIPEVHIVNDITDPSAYSKLWEAADAYQKQYISSAAFGLVTEGVIANKTKALAVKAWITSLWSEYYLRKTDIENASYDFSSIGTLPYTIQELMNE